ncbi:MAG: integrase core domain-containing protein [Burkholderiales bacterium]
MQLCLDQGVVEAGNTVPWPWPWFCVTACRWTRPSAALRNAFVERRNGTFRGECLNVHGFDFLDDGGMTSEAWRQDDNVSRPPLRSVSVRS